MSLLSIIYLTVGLITLIWPLSILFFRRKVLGSQWLMTVALYLFGLSVVLYSTFFNTFLMGEYILVILYMVMSLSVLPITQAAIAIYTRPQGANLMSKILVLPSFITIGFMVVSVAIGGIDMYRLWIHNSAEGMADHFFSGSWRYNLIVAVHFYLYWIVLISEALYVMVYVSKSIRRLSNTLNEYFTSEHHNLGNIRGIYITVGINCLCVLIFYLFFPFNRPRPLGVAFVLCLVQAVDLFLLGRYTYYLGYGAERLASKLHSNRFGRGNLDELGHQIVQYVEQEEHYLNPDLSVFMLSEFFKVSQDDVVDAIHRMQGTPFGDYITSLRVEKASDIMMNQPDIVFDDEEQLEQVAHSCGFLSVEALQHAFVQVMHTPLKEWVEHLD